MISNEPLDGVAKATEADGPTKDVEAVDYKTKNESVTDGQDPRSTATQPLQGFKLYAVAVGVCFGAVMMSLDISVIATAIPTITSDFGDTSQIGWYPAAYTFTVCAFTPIAGKIASVFPLKWVYQCFCCIFLIGSLICGFARTSPNFIAGRAIAGVGAGGLAANGLTILLAIAEDKKKPLFMGLGAACFSVGVILGPILGGVLTQKLTWRWCFWINLPPGAITLAVIFFFCKPHPPGGGSVTSRIRSLDLVGCFIFVPTIFMLLLALEMGQYDWNSPNIIGLFVGSGVMVILFVAWEGRKGIDAMLPGIVVARRTVICTVLFAFCHMGSLQVATYYLPEWFQAVRGLGPLKSGTNLLPTVITQIVVTIAASAPALKIKYYNPWFFLGPIFLCTATALYTQFTAFLTPPSHWLGFQVIQGVGSGLGMQMSSLAVQLELRNCPDLVPIGISLVIFVQYLGSTFFQVIAGTIFSSQLKKQLISHAGLTTSQMSLLLDGGNRSVREITSQNFPTLLRPILEAYNSAITKVFFVPVAATTAAFFIAFGIQWNKIELPSTNQPTAETESKPDDIEGQPP